MKTEFSAKSIFNRVAVGDCVNDWTLEEIKKYLAKHNKTKVSALWIAERRDLQRKDKLWGLLCEKEDRELSGVYPLANGLAPPHIRNKVRKYLKDRIRDAFYGRYVYDAGENWEWDYIPCVRGLEKKAMELVTKLLREE